MPDMLGIPEIAKRLKVDSGTVRRFMARVCGELGLDLQRGKGDRWLLSRDDAEKLIASYQARLGPVSPGEDGPAKYESYGYFYVIQLVPEAIPERVKIGFADSVEQRLNEHRTAAPTARLVKIWPCKRSWDYAAMDSITREGCKLVLNEVFEGTVEGFVQRGDDFFGVMPNPDSEKELSQHSPLYPQTESEGAEVAG